MTIYIAHRQNDLKRVKYKNNSFFDGIEIDVRSDSKNIILNHDPFKKSLILFKNLKKLEKFFLIIDVKSTGICR